MIVVVFGQERLAARSMARSELKDVSERTSYRVNQLLRAAEMTAESAARAMGAKAVPARDWESVFARLVPAFEQRPELTYLGFSLASTGEAAFLHRRTDGIIEWLLFIDADDGKRVIRNYRYQLGRFYLVDETPWDGYDPRSRPFFLQAAATRKPGWTESYDFVDYEGRRPVNGVTFVLPVLTPNGELSAVWDADFDAGTLCDFLRLLRHETGAPSFIVETLQNGQQRLLAHPDDQHVGRGGVPAQTPEQWMNEQARFLLADSSARWLGRAQNLPAGAPQWYVCTLSDGGKAAAAFHHRQRWWVIAVAGLSMAIAVVGSLLFARQAARPFEKLQDAVHGLALGKAPDVELRAVPRELLDLGESFREMVKAISDRQQELAKTNSSLQLEIARRTEREALLDAVLSHIPFELWVFDVDGKCMLQNPAAERRTGNIGGRAIIHAAQAGTPLSPLPENFSRILSGAVVARDIVGQQDGRIVFSHVVFAPVMSGDRTTGVVCASIDVTEQRRAEEALRSSQRRLSLHLENTPLGVIDWTPDFKVAAWNPAAELIFGWPAAEAIGRDGAFLLPEHERESVAATWQALLNGKTGSRYSNQNLTRNGRLIETEWYSTVVADADGRVASISSLVLDVTERASAEKLFRESEERFQKAFRRAPIPQAIVRLVDGCIIDVNDRWEQAFGVERRNVSGRTALDLGLWHDTEMRAEVLRQLDQFGEIHDREVKLIRAGGQLGVFLLSITLVKIEDDATMLVTQVDITERQQAEAEVRALNEGLEKRVADRTRELEKANTKLKELDKLKSEFLATMSHELRTPLNSIIGFSAILKQGMAGPLNPEQAKQMEMIHGSARHLLGLINDLLDVSRVEAGRVELFLEQVNVTEVLNDVEKTMAPFVASKHLNYATESQNGLPAIVTDRKRLFQIVLNLANNAVKFTEHGSVTVTATMTADDHLCLCVRDTGIGIRTENLGRLFEAFRQVDGSARRVYEGTGLGLFLVKKLLGLLGGQISVESEFGKGSAFTVVLPLVPATKLRQSETASLWDTRPPYT